MLLHAGEKLGTILASFATPDATHNKKWATT